MYLTCTEYFSHVKMIQQNCWHPWVSVHEQSLYTDQVVIRSNLKKSCNSYFERFMNGFYLFGHHESELEVVAVIPIYCETC